MSDGHNPQFIEEMKGMLEAQKAKIERTLSQFATKTAKGDDFNTVFPEFGDDEDENAEEIATYDTNLQLEETLEAEMRDVNSALDRVAKGNYGICKYCEKLIDEKRLRARPTSSSCVSCKKTITQEA